MSTSHVNVAARVVESAASTVPGHAALNGIQLSTAVGLSRARHGVLIAFERAYVFSRQADR